VSTIQMYVGTQHGTSMYIETNLLTHINYIFRNRAISEHEYIIPVNAHEIDSDFSGEISLGIFFNTEVSVFYENGIASNFRFTYIPAPVREQPPATAPRTAAEIANSIRSEQQQPPATNLFIDAIENINNYHIILVVCILGAFLVLKRTYKKIKLERAQKNWAEKYENIKQETEHARVSRGWLPKNQQVYDDYLKKHKLDPLPDSLFRKTPQEGAHYNSAQWSANPNLINGNEYTLFNEGKIEVLCPNCDGLIFKQRNFFTNMHNYVCNNPACTFTTMDFTNIKPLKCRVSEEVRMKEILKTNKDF